MKKILSCLLSMMLLLTVLPSVLVFAEDAAAGTVPFTAVSEQTVAIRQNPVERMSDGDESTYTIFDLEKGNPVIDLSFHPSNVTGVRVALTSFIAWRGVKTVKVTLSDGQSAEQSLPQSTCGVNWLDFALAAENVDSAQVELTGLYDNNSSHYCAVTEIQVNGEEISTGGGEEQAEKKLAYETELTVPLSSGLSGGSFPAMFDDDMSSNGTFNPLEGAYMVIQFAYPTDVTKLRFKSVRNGDWAMATSVELEVYNEDVKYRRRLQNPVPLETGIRKELTTTSEFQDLEVADQPTMKEVTHLLLRYPTVSKFKEASVWGAFSAIEVYGVMHKEETPVAQMIAYENVDTLQLLTDMGIVDPKPEEMSDDDYRAQRVTRLDAMKMLLRFSGEYDKAMSWQGEYNYDDAGEVPEYENLLSYIYTYRNKYPFFGGGTFEPDMHVTPREWYALLISQIGRYNADNFEDETVRSQAFNLGMGDSLYSAELNLKEACIALYELLGQTYVDNGEVVIERMRRNGIITDEDVFRFYTKYDTEEYASNGNYDPNNDPWFTVDSDGSFSFTKMENPKVISPDQFFVNTPYHFKLINDGILPEDDANSMREEFARMLKESGWYGMRLPGGAPTMGYFIEGYEYDKRFWEMLQNIGNKPDFNPTPGSSTNYHADFWNWLDFCKEYDILTMFEINPYFYVDPVTDEIKASVPSRQSHDNSGKNWYYDGTNHIEEAAAALGRHCDKMLELGYEIDYWEVGNEDYYWVNYDRSPTWTHAQAQNYFDLVAAFTKEIIKRFPDAKIIYTAFGGDFDVQEYLTKKGVWGLPNLVGPAQHYPYAAWNAPSPSEKRNIKRLVYTNDNNFVGYVAANAAHYEGYNSGDTVPPNAAAKPSEECCITETMVYKLESWDCYYLQDKFGMALDVIKNWGEGVFETPWKVMCMHELESTYFGFIKADIALHPATRATMRASDLKGFYTSPSFDSIKNDIPEAYTFQGDKLFLSAAGKAVALLSNHLGGEVLQETRSSYKRHVAAYASEDPQKGEVKITMVNRMEEAAPVQIKLSDWTVEPQQVEGRVMQSDYLWAVLEQEYTDEVRSFDVAGNVGNPDANAIELTMEPYSIIQLTVKAK